MGNFANEQELIVQNNLPSRRWKIRRIRTAYDKKLRQLDKKHTHVYNEIRILGYEKLEKPIQRGYKRLFVLTEETKYSTRADFYQQILDKINTVRYSPHKTFKERKRKIGKWKFCINNEQELQTPSDYIFHYQGNFTNQEKQFFYPVEFYHAPSKTHQKRYVFAERWRYRLQIKPHIITEVQIKDSVLEQYCQELSDYLDIDKNRRRLTKMRGGYTHSWKRVMNESDNKKKYCYNSLKNKPLYLVMEEYKEEIQQ